MTCIEVRAAARERAAGLLLVLLAALLWSLGGVGIKLVSQEAESMAIAGYRALLAIPVLLLPILLSAARPLALFSQALRWPAVWLGALSYAVTVVCFVLANKLTTAANAILLQYTAPIYVALLSWPLLRERISRVDLLCALVCLCGMASFFAERLSASGWQGNLLAIISGVGFGLLPVMLRLIRRQARTPEAERLYPLCTIVLGNVLSALSGLPWMIGGAPATLSGWTVLALLGFLQIGLAYLLFASGVRRVPALQSMLVAMAEPILNPVWVALWIGERPSGPAIFGGALILLAVAGHSLWTHRHRLYR
jgi:drug/metabolite transporter (DMT)-like permease